MVVYCYSDYNDKLGTESFQFSDYHHLSYVPLLCTGFPWDEELDHRWLRWPNLLGWELHTLSRFMIATRISFNWLGFVVVRNWFRSLGWLVVVFFSFRTEFLYVISMFSQRRFSTRKIAYKKTRVAESPLHQVGSLRFGLIGWLYNSHYTILRRRSLGTRCKDWIRWLIYLFCQKWILLRYY